jgi:oligoribonuclease (3'-5' exoribonuclease)
MQLNEEYILSIAEELKYLGDIVPPNISGLLAIQRDLNFNRDRRIFLQKNHPNIIKEMRQRRIEVISLKNSEDRKKKQIDFVKEFIKKYPKWDNIILK